MCLNDVCIFVGMLCCVSVGICGFVRRERVVAVVALPSRRNEAMAGLVLAVRRCRLIVPGERVDVGSVLPERIDSLLRCCGVGFRGFWLAQMG